MTSVFWNVATYVVLISFLLIILGCAIAFVLTIIDFDRDDVFPEVHSDPPDDVRRRLQLDLSARVGRKP